MDWRDSVKRVVPYVPGEQPDKPGIIKLNTNECPYPPAPGVAEAVKQLDWEDLRRYPDALAKNLVDGLAARYHVAPEQVFVGVGSDDVLAMCYLTFFQTGKPILFPDVTYAFYDVWAKLYDIPYETCPLDENFHICAKDYKRPNGGIIFPNPNAPTGILEPLSLIEEILQANPGVVVIVDEAYVDFGGVSCMPLLEKYSNLLVVQTFSKSRAMAGSRIGFAIGNKELIGYLSDVKFSFNSYTMNSPSLAIGRAALDDETYFRETTGKIVATRERFKRELTQLGFSFPDGKGNFLFATHKEIPAGELYAMLREKDIFVRYWDKPRINNYLRITIGTDREMDRLVEVLQEYITEKNC